jgi:hypothetical protein
LTVEYVYNSAGYSDGQAEDYFDMADDLSAEFVAGGASAPAAAELLGRARAPGLPLLRRHYLFLQFLHTNINDQFDITVRYTRNLDDQGSSLVPIIEWDASDYVRLFAQGVFNFGKRDSEFGRYLNRQVLMGINVTF